MLTITGIDELKAKVGEELGVSEWHEVTQAEIDAFADATGDHQWIHVDPERAAQSPFGSTIAHGLYTLGLGPRFTYEAYDDRGLRLRRQLRLRPRPLPGAAAGRLARPHARDARRASTTSRAASR